MPYSFETLIDPDFSRPFAPLDAADFVKRVQQLVDVDGPRFTRMWNYYRNRQIPSTLAADSASARPYRSAQEWGLPSRITGMRPPSGSSASLSGDALDVARKEVVIENDIAWRIDTMVDYLFGKAPTLRSTASDPTRRNAIETIANAVLDQHGGVVFLQQLALLGAVYGFVDVLVKLDTDAASIIANELNTTELPTTDLRPGLPTNVSDPSSDGTFPSQREALDEVASISESSDALVPPPAGSAPVLPDDSAPDAPAVEPSPSFSAASAVPDDAMLIRIARCIRLEIVEPARALPLLRPTDWRTVDAYAQVYSGESKSRRTQTTSNEKQSWLNKLFGNVASASSRNSETTRVTEIITPTRWARFEDESLVASGVNSLGELPLVHIQNVALPFEYAGTSDVEPLLPLQDELNTRLSDRAHRITMQSFKMYLGKGIDNFTSLPISPGQMWMTDNEQASIVEFGGDADSPSETSHIDQVRESMDKTSGVTPIAAGILRDRIGQLTSATALRVTLTALLAKTDRKRTTYGAGVTRICELCLAWLDRAGLFRTSLDERRFVLQWPDATPTDIATRLADAEAKLRVGVDRAIVLEELGYSPTRST